MTPVTIIVIVQLILFIYTISCIQLNVRIPYNLSIQKKVLEMKPDLKSS